MPTRRRRAAPQAIAGTIVLSLVALSCSGSSTAYHGPEGRSRVALVGDSITVLLEPVVKPWLHAAYRWQIRAHNGLRIDEQLDTLHDVVSDPAGPPGALVINLGTNDAYQNRRASLDDIHTAFDIVSEVPCVIWVTVSRAAGQPGETLWAELNQEMVAATRRRPNFHVLDWDALVHRDDHLDQWTTLVDDIHPSTAGAAALSDLYRRAIAEDCPAVGPPPTEVPVH